MKYLKRLCTPFLLSRIYLHEKYGGSWFWGKYSEENEYNAIMVINISYPLFLIASIWFILARLNGMVH